MDSPNTNIKDKDGDVTSLNKFFGAPMSCGNGMGLSLNRYSKLTGKYYLDESTLAAPTISTERKSCTSIRYTWGVVDGAESYTYSVTDTKGKKVVKSRTTSETAATVTGLTTGEKYTFTLAANATDRSVKAPAKPSPACRRLRLSHGSAPETRAWLSAGPPVPMWTVTRCFAALRRMAPLT